MMKLVGKVSHVARWRVPLILLVAMLALVGPGVAQDNPAKQADTSKIDPKATAILRRACETLSGAQTMAFTAVDTYERAARNGQPLYYAVRSQVILQRPDKLRVIKLGDGIPDEFYYDGKTMAAYVPSANLVAVADAPPTVDKMLEAAWGIGAIYFPFADVMASKPCAVFDDAISAFYVGQSVVVGNTTTDMVAVASDGIQAEIWIGATDHLPRLVRVVYTNEPAHAHYQTEYSDWKLGVRADASAFRSDKLKTAKHIDFAPPGSAAPPNRASAGATEQPGLKQP
jgi:hypothetical protein